MDRNGHQSFEEGLPDKFLDYSEYEQAPGNDEVNTSLQHQSPPPHHQTMSNVTLLQTPQYYPYSMNSNRAFDASPTQFQGFYTTYLPSNGGMGQHTGDFDQVEENNSGGLPGTAFDQSSKAFNHNNASQLSDIEQSLNTSSAHTSTLTAMNNIDTYASPSDTNVLSSPDDINIFSPFSDDSVFSPLSDPNTASSPASTDQIGGPPDSESSSNILLVRAVETAILSHDNTYTIRSTSGVILSAVLFSDVYRDNEREDRTTYSQYQSQWTDVRGAGRPEILYQLQPNQEFADLLKQASREQGKRQGQHLVFEPWFDSQSRVIVNQELKPLRFLWNLPVTLSSRAPGWVLEALWRINPLVKQEDLVDRMPSTNNLIPQPSIRALHNRRAKDRHVMRITNWNSKVLRGDFWEHIIRQDLDAWGVSNNSTARLTDLSVDQHSFMEEMRRDRGSEGGADEAVEYYGNLIARARDAGYGDGHWVIDELEAKLESWEDA